MSEPVRLEPRDLRLAALRAAALGLPALLVAGELEGLRAGLGAWLALGGAVGIATLFERHASRVSDAESRITAGAAWFFAIVLGVALGFVQVRFVRDGWAGLPSHELAGAAIAAALVAIVPAGCAAWVIGLRLELSAHPGDHPIARILQGALLWGLVVGLVVMAMVLATAMGGDLMVVVVLLVVAPLLGFMLTFAALFFFCSALLHLFAALDWLERRCFPIAEAELEASA